MLKKFNWGKTLSILLLGLAVAGQPDTLLADGEDAPWTIEGRIFEGGLDAEQRAVRATPRRLDPAAPIGHEMNLGPFDLERFLGKSENRTGGTKPLIIGAHRELPHSLRAEMGAPDLEWEPARGGGEVAVFSVTSPEAEALRVALDFHRLPDGAEVRFYSPAEPRAAAGSFKASFLASARRSDGPFWSPLVNGETMVVEIWVPRERGGADLGLTVRQVSHVYRSIDGKDLSQLGASGGCNRDVACLKKWRTAGDSVAKIVFEVFGGTALCTGQLMANPDGSLLFLTAAHCIATRREAASASFFWFFERAACNGADPTAVIQTSGGARRLFTALKGTRPESDHTLLLLKRDPPAGVSMMGSTTADLEDQVDTKVHGVHHPSGDVKRVSRGRTEDRTVRAESLVNGAFRFSLGAPKTHLEVLWRLGTTEGGSSGSFLAVGKKWPKQFVVGVLSAGSAACSNRNGSDFYGSFEVASQKRKFRKHFD